MYNPRQQAIELYAHTAWEKFLSTFKYWEEPYEVVEKLVPKKGKVLDMGCGEGLLANYLALASKNRKVLGVEIASERVKRAKKKVPNTTYRVGDATKYTYPKSDVIIFFHVLHHLRSYENQRTALEKAKKALNKGGKLIVVEILVQPSLKYLATWIADNFLVPWVFEGRFYTQAFFRKEKEWKAFLKEQGFKVNKTLHEVKGRPFPNIIFECKKA